MEQTTLKLILIITSLISIAVLNPLGDAIRDNGNKRLQKTIEIIRDFLFFVLIGIYSGNMTVFICLGLSHFFLRTSIHNLTYNLSRRPKLPWWFTGTTSGSDDIEKSLSKFQALAFRILSLVFSAVLLWLSFK